MASLLPALSPSTSHGAFSRKRRHLTPGLDSAYCVYEKVFHHVQVRGCDFSENPLKKSLSSYLCMLRVDHLPFSSHTVDSWTPPGRTLDR